MSRYVKLAEINSNYAKRMNRLSNRIFGEVTRPTNNKSMRVVKVYQVMPIEKRPEVKDWYPPLPQIGWLMRKVRDYGLFRDEHLDFREEYIRLRALRGKFPWSAKSNKKAQIAKLEQQITGK